MIISNYNMISVYLMGGLGNQLFQIFTVIAYFLEYKKPFKLPLLKNDLSSPYGKEYKRPLYFESFLKRLKPYTTNTFKKGIVHREKIFEYNKIPKYDVDVLLYGYYQSYKYFDNYKDSILKLIDFKSYKENISNTYNYDNTISLHFRIGDYIHNTEAHPILSIEYYKKALEHIINKTKKMDYTVIYYYEKKDVDKVNKNIEELKKTFSNINFKESPENLHDWEEMISMSCCTHNIIANSTFSWWAAYLNENLDKIVCYPSVWVGGTSQNIDLTDMFLDKWSKIIV